MDASPENIYAAYEGRWGLEVLFRFYKRILMMDEIRVESDQSVTGTEFVNFLSTVMTCRLRKKFYSIRPLCKKPYKANMKLLEKEVMICESKGSEWKLKRLIEKQEKAFLELGLIRMPVAEKKCRSRPSGSKNKPKVQ